MEQMNASVEIKTVLGLSSSGVGAGLKEIAAVGQYSYSEISQLLGASLTSVVKLAREDSPPNKQTLEKIDALLRAVRNGERPQVETANVAHTFASHGARRSVHSLPLFCASNRPGLAAFQQRALLDRLKPSEFWGAGEQEMADLLREHRTRSATLDSPASGGISAGKNTYTYDAHTYHTKVPPQGIAEVLQQYLPEGGLVLDPFAGSGMTGVAAKVVGCDVVLNELSPAASFIADRFTHSIDPGLFAAGLELIRGATKQIRADLYETGCRECGKSTELQYTVWSYQVICPSCNEYLVLWDHCRKYGRTVRDHKILSEFPCPHCKNTLKKSRLERTTAVPVLVGYKCCAKTQVEHAPNADDLERIERIERGEYLAAGFYPTTELPDGMNLCQPKRHGITSVGRFYTARNLAAMSHIWRAIQFVEEQELAGFLGFVFTSLYQRVTRLSEYRFWGGSGNTAHFNVPYIFNEANVFVTFARKARTIQDHLGTTALKYRGRSVIRTGSATDLSFLPDDSIDLIFTDPPFGGNINYSEMNILWEAWLGSFTNNRDEAIVNKFQNKGAAQYGNLMAASLRECRRVLRQDHWMLLVFMNSSEQIWSQLRRAIDSSGFSLERIDVFDKQHGTFKQFVSDNTAGCDLILHCKKSKGSPGSLIHRDALPVDLNAVAEFLRLRKQHLPKSPYLHVAREEEIDFRMLYSEWLSTKMLDQTNLVDFSSFRALVTMALKQESGVRD